MLTFWETGLPLTTLAWICCVFYSPPPLPAVRRTNELEGGDIGGGKLRLGFFLAIL